MERALHLSQVSLKVLSRAWELPNNCDTSGCEAQWKKAYFGLMLLTNSGSAKRDMACRSALPNS